jgi:phenylacetic acid degradation operon negative regulatory protein
MIPADSLAGLPEELPETNRRLETGAPSARSLLLTILGEFMFPQREAVWTATFVGALAAVGVEEKAARQALARTAADGIIVPVRIGRRTRWELSDAGRTLLRDGTRRIYGFMRERRRWDGRWLVLAITVPETQRQLRHRLRTRLTWAGMGSPAAGLWVVPYADRAPEIARIVSELGIAGNTMSWIGESGGIGRPADVVAAAWASLEEVERAYAAFVAEFERRRAESRAASFAAQVDLVQAWRRFPFIDPALPVELLDHDWPGQRAAAVFHGCHERWHRRAQAYWAALSALDGSDSSAL